MVDSTVDVDRTNIYGEDGDVWRGEGLGSWQTHYALFESDNAIHEPGVSWVQFDIEPKVVGMNALPSLQLIPDCALTAAELTLATLSAGGSTFHADPSFIYLIIAIGTFITIRGWWTLSTPLGTGDALVGLTHIPLLAHAAAILFIAWEAVADSTLDTGWALQSVRQRTRLARPLMPTVQVFFALTFEKCIPLHTPLTSAFNLALDTRRLAYSLAAAIGNWIVGLAVGADCHWRAFSAEHRTFSTLVIGYIVPKCAPRAIQIAAELTLVAGRHALEALALVC